MTSDYDAEEVVVPGTSSTIQMTDEKIDTITGSDPLCTGKYPLLGSRRVLFQELWAYEYKVGYLAITVDKHGHLRSRREGMANE